MSAKRFGRLVRENVPLFPLIWSAKAFATSRPPVSLFHSGCDRVVAMVSVANIKGFLYNSCLYDEV
jgi:hypothetical protein